MKKKYLGLICIIYSIIIIYVWASDILKNFLAPQMQIYIKVASIILLIMALVILLNNKFDYKFKMGDLILLLPIIMIILSGDARLTSSLASNRSTKYNVEQKIQEEKNNTDNEIIEEKKENKEESKYDFTNPYFDVKDETFDALSSFITFVENSKKYHGQTIKLKGFALTSASYIPKGHVAVGRFAISCCAADAEFLGFILKDDNLNLVNDKWYEVEGVLEESKDKSLGILTVIKVINIKEIDGSNEDPYVYQCYAYGDGNCSEVAKYNLEY